MKSQYKISLSVLAALFAVGVALQLAIGGLDTVRLAWPVSIIVLSVLVLAIAGLTLYREKPFFRWLTGVPFSVSLIAALLVCCVVMGLVPQWGVQPGDFISRLGLYDINSSWPFVLFYMTLLLSLGCIVAGSLVSTGFRRWGFLLNHLGLWLVLLGAGVGSADYRELAVMVYEGETEIHATEKHTGEMTGMPFALRLDDFSMEEYPVRWGVVDIRTDKFQPEKHPVFYDTDKEAFLANPSLGTHQVLASTLPEPSNFISEITVTAANGKETHATVRVNHPYRHGSWSVYQYGYDTDAGNESEYSVFQLVRDPWLPVVYAGVAMLALGALALFITAFKKRRDDGVE